MNIKNKQYFNKINSELNKLNLSNNPKELYEPIKYILKMKSKKIRPMTEGLASKPVKSIKSAKSKGIMVVERKIKPEEMVNFVGCFLTGTAAEVTPVSQIDKYKFTICNVIKDLSESYQTLVRKKTAA